MTRQINPANQIWYETTEEHGAVQTKVGFTKSFLDSLDQCWHILPANLTKFRKKAPLLTIETNDALISILSPVSGSFVEFNRKAQDFPDKLTEEDVILRVQEGAVAIPNQQPPQVNLAAAEGLRQPTLAAAGRRPLRDEFHWSIQDEMRLVPLAAMDDNGQGEF